MTTPPTTGWFTGRTKLITFASIAAVAAAGAVAVGANLGILNAAAETNVGSLSATGAEVTPSTQIIYVDEPVASTTTTGTAAGSQQFAVDAAGSATVSATETSIRLESVAPTAGWTWSLAQPDATHLTVVFTDGTRTLEFLATAQADGSIAASVSEPIATPAPAPAGGNGGHEDDDDDEHEYEGGDDDD